MTKKVLFINQEIIPYVPETELSVMGKSVPQAILDKGWEIRTFMPKWGNINERRGQLHEVIRLSGMNLIIDDTDHPLIIKVATIPQTRIQVYFIDNDDYFSKRSMTTDSEGAEYEDNGERAVFFARGVLETVKKLRWAPDIIHCQGWMSAVIPFYIKTAYAEEPSFANTKIITSLSSQGFKGDLADNFKKCIEHREATPERLDAYAEIFNYDELMKLAIDHSDGIIEASPDTGAALKEHAIAKGKKLLEYPGADFADAYQAFYESL